jgi:hypothetical protein
MERQAWLRSFPSMQQKSPDLDEQLSRFEHRMPAKAAAVVRWLRKPESRYVRIPVALALVLGGVFSILPVLGIWMLPLGLVLIAQDIPFLRPPMARMLAWIDRKWPARTEPARQKAPSSRV